MKKQYRIKSHFLYANAPAPSSAKPQTTEEKLDALLAKETAHRVQPEKVYAHSSLYQQVFGKGKTLKGTNREKRYVKITSGETGQTIWRVFRGVPMGVASDGILYMDADSKYTLKGDETENVELEIKKSNVCAYYWHSPIVAERISFKLGLLSLILGIISLASPFIK